MDAKRFDTFARTVVTAGSRRRVLTALGAGALLTRFGVQEAAACVGLGAPCGNGSPCCPANLTCKKGRCRCTKGWKHCTGSVATCETHVQTDDANCGSCGKQCPVAKPCCRRGKCQNNNCGFTCCPDCFVELNMDGTIGNPGCCTPGGDPNFEFVCHKPGTDTSEDVCCAQDQLCLDGKCCLNNGLGGSVVCDGKCCAESACCNKGERNETCCPKGKYCGIKNGVASCVADGGPCVPGAACAPGVICLDGACCPTDRVCDSPRGQVCCPSGTYCSALAEGGVGCCEVGYTCIGTNIKHKIRA